MAKTVDGTTNILIVGVGGQGVILASEILSAVAMKTGYDVKKSEVHGMAQRGGVVSSHVKYGPQVFSPLIQQGKVDVLLSFEEAEALRWLGFLKPNGRAIVNLQEIIPPIVSTGLAEYPRDAKDHLIQKTRDPIMMDALVLAVDLGNPRLVNTILLGALSTMLDLPARHWRRVIGERVPSDFKNLNLKAFEEGRKVVS